MELWNAIGARAGQVLLGFGLSALLYALCNTLLDEYVTPLSGGSAAAVGYWIATRGADDPIEPARYQDASAWGLGVLAGVLLMHTLVQGGVL